MSNEQSLVPVNLDQLPSTQLGSDKGFDDIAKGVDFLMRLQLFSKGSAVNRGLIAPGHWGIPESSDEVTDLGVTVDLLPLARRPKAVDLSDKDAIVSNYDMNSDEFKRIQNASAGKDSGCMYGPSFLVYERSTGRFLEWFCGTKSTRSEAKKIYPYLPLTESDIQARKLGDVEPHGPMPLTMKIKLIENKYSYHVPQVVKCSTPFTGLPPMDKIVEEIERFLNPQDSGVEKVTEEESKRRAR